jgi:gliding motility-associated-like protein
MTQHLRSIFLTFFFCIFTSHNIVAQIQINTGVNAQGLVNNLVGGGITTSGAVINAAPQSFGTFTAANSNIGLTGGVILTTGRAPSNQGFFGIEQGCPIINNATPLNAFASTNNLSPGIPQLNSLAGGNTFDGATLQFTFTPESTPLTFRYVFASEEYPDFAPSFFNPSPSNFNDAFGFFISGPGITGEQNIALLPGTTTPVTINNVNQVFNSQYYVVNNGNTCAYNAFTTVLTATANVIPCSTYTIKLMIADGWDSSYDSAVFLEENSFGSAPFFTETTTIGGDNITYEGCAPATVTFKRPVATNQPLTINYTIGGTATMGVDYQNIPTSVTIPANQTSTTIQIVGIEDGIPENTETIILTYSTGCGQTTSDTIFLKDKPPVIVVVSDNAAICDGSGPITLTANASGGLAPITYSWNNGAGTNPTATVNPSVNTSYTVVATDYCGTMASGIINVSVAPTPAAPTLVSNSPVCNGQNLTISISGVPNGIGNWSGPNAYTSTGPSMTINNVSPANAGSYSATVTVNGCTSAPSSTNIVISPSPAAPTLASNAPICMGSNLNLSASGVGGATYNWTGPNGYTSSQQNPTINNISQNQVGQYAATVTVNGCPSQPATINPIITPLPSTPTVSSNSPICGSNPLNLTASNIQGASYSWTGPNGFVSNEQNPTITNMSEDFMGEYSVTVTVNGCTSLPVVTTVFPASAGLPVISYNNPVCVGQTLQFTGPTLSNTTYAWTGPNGFTSTLQNPFISNVTLDAIGQYNLVVNEGGCISEPSNINVVIEPMPISNFIPDLNSGCVPLKVAFQNLSETTSGQLTYLWDLGNGTTSQTINPTYVYSEAGTYTVKLRVTNASGCSDTYTVNGLIRVLPKARAEFSVYPWEIDIIDPEIELTSFATDASEGYYLISTGDTVDGLNGTFTFDKEGDYTITQVATNEFGCADTLTKPLRVNLGFRLYFPSSFSPNNDGINDLFKPFGEGYDEFEIQIYNRWGELIYKSFDINNGWDGTTRLSNKFVDSSVYFYKAFATDEKGKKHEFKGWVTLLR